MKKLVRTVFGPLIIGLVTGLAALYLGAYAYDTALLRGSTLFASYFDNPLTVFMNLLMPVLAAFLFYFVFSRLWISALLCSIVFPGIALVNFYKILLRNDPLMMADVTLLRTAADAAKRYHFTVTPEVIKAVLACFILVLVMFLFFRKNDRPPVKLRIIGAVLALAACVSSVLFLYYSPPISDKTTTKLDIDFWDPTQVYVSRGCIYPFIKSGHNMNRYTPQDYDRNAAIALLADYEDSSIEDNKRVNIIAVQLEAFADLSELDTLSSIPAVQQHYENWHRLCEESISGHIITNVIGGGTTDTEWCFLTGYSQFNEFRHDTDSYVRYLKQQGYSAYFFHPGNNFYYNRKLVCNYLGFDSSLFSENGFGKLVSPQAAPYGSDDILFSYVLEDFRKSEDPVFSFTVTYQGHGPYESDWCYEEYLDSSSGLSDKSRNILNNYFHYQEDTVQQLVKFRDALAEEERPVVLIVYGDHKPWAGDSESVYHELGCDFDLSTEKGLTDEYSAPYFIWANDAAKKTLGKDFTGTGRDISPCYLMAELFDACGFEGSYFTKISRDMRSFSRLLHHSGIYIYDGQLTGSLPGEAGAFYKDYLNVQYYLQSQGTDR